MKKALLVIGIILVGIVVIRSVSRPALKHFSASEFGIWWPLMSADLLRKLDAFREGWGAPVRISPVDGAMGRHGGSTMHNVDLTGQVRAIDVFPEGMTTASDRQRAYDLAVAVGFTGVGIYTDTNPSNLLHVDVRPDRKEGRPAKWSRVNGEYMGINEVLA